MVNGKKKSVGSQQQNSNEKAMQLWKQIVDSGSKNDQRRAKW
jgi:hypothetical protein